MKKSLRLYILGLLGLMFLLAFKKPLQENLLLQKIIGKLLIYGDNQRPEKTFLHTDKDFYTNGETIWFKTYLVDGITHETSPKSKVVYVELVDNKDSIVERRKLFVENLGASGDIQLDNDIAQGEYTLRSYTKYMLNGEDPIVFEKSVPIFVQDIRSNVSAENVPLSKSLTGFSSAWESARGISGKPKIKFFPEGGNLVAGISGTLGLEVTDTNGNGLAVKGNIVDSDGNLIEPFESHEFGLGSFGFIPKPNKKYHASLIINGVEEKYPLPDAAPKGYVMSLKNREDHILVQVASNTDEGLAGTLLVGHLRGDLIFKRIGNKYDQNEYATKIYTKELADGVAQFTLFDPSGEPVSERLLFVDDPSNDTQLTISSPMKGFGTREKVDLNLALTDSEGTPLTGDFSLGVVSKSSSNTSTSNIKSWLLLDSDLGGTVSNPDYFFADKSKERKFLLDALMLTHGWRRFVWKDMLSQKVVKKPAYEPEKGIMVNGRTAFFGQPFKTKQTVATLNIYGPDIVNSKKQTTPQGAFSFGPFHFKDTLEATVEAYDSIPKWEYKRKNLSIVIDNELPKFTSKLQKSERTDRQTITLAQEYLKDTYLKKVADFKYDPKEVTVLDEAIVTEKKKTRKEIINEAYNAQRSSGLFSKRVYRDSIPGSAAFSAIDLLIRVPGVRVAGAYPNQSVVLPGGMNSILAAGNPAVVVNGSLASFDFLQTLRAIEVSFIDVTLGPDAAIFGVLGGSGVISVYMDMGLRLFDDELPEEYPGVTNFKIPGFYKAREFYKPDYVKEKPEKPDFRTTLFWEPQVALNNEGKSSINFYTGDKTGSYWVKVEGITNDGRPVSGIYDIDVLE